MATPRVLQVVLSLNPGGTERLVLELVRRLSTDVPMAVCCLDDEGAWAADLKHEGIAVTALGRPGGFVPSLGRRIAAIAAEHRADVVHCHHYSPFVYAALARLWRPATRVIFTEHGRLSDSAPSPKRRLANRALSLAPHGVFTVSQELRRHVVAEGFADGAVKVIYNGISVGRLPNAFERRVVRKDLGVDADTLVLCTIARLDAVKDLGVLIRAAGEVGKQTSVLLVVIGDGPERQALEAVASESGAHRWTRFFGHRDDARRWLAGADVYVNTSISEGISLTVLEAMAAGLPVVATAVGGTPEIVNPACGRLVPARDPRAVANVLLDLARNRELRMQLGQSARQRVEKLFTIERMVDQYRRVYHEVA